MYIYFHIYRHYSVVSLSFLFFTFILCYMCRVLTRCSYLLYTFGLRKIFSLSYMFLLSTVHDYFVIFLDTLIHRDYVCIIFSFIY